jgi:hypothetical protein
MLERPNSRDTLGGWITVAVVVIAIHAGAIWLLLRAHNSAHSALPAVGDGAGLAGAVSGAAPPAVVRTITCRYVAYDRGFALDSIDRATYGPWAACPATVDTSGLLNEAHATGAQSSGASIAIELSVDSGGIIASTSIDQDGRQPDFAKALQRRVESLPHATPPGMSRMSASVPYTFIFSPGPAPVRH